MGIDKEDIFFNPRVLTGLQFKTMHKQKKNKNKMKNVHVNIVKHIAKEYDNVS